MKTPTKALLALVLLPASLQAANFAGNGNTGFGGVISSLDITDNGSDITLTLNRGAGDLNDRFVLYIDSVGGGFSSTSSFDDNADPLRAAISGTGQSSGTSDLNFGFDADFAIGLDGSFSGLWQLASGGANAHVFVAVANGAPGGATEASYAMTVALSDLGLNPGDSFDFVATYLNADNAFRSDEGIGDGIQTPNPGNDSVTFTGFRSYTTVPEPSVALLGGIGLLGLLRRRR